MRYFFGFSVLLLTVLVLQNCGNPYNGFGSGYYGDANRARIRFSSNTDLKKRIDRFDNEFSAKSLAESLGAGALSENASKTLMHQELAANCTPDSVDADGNARPCSFTQFLVNMRSVIPYAENLGDIKIFVTKRVNGQDVGQHINTLILPEGVDPDTLFKGTYSFAESNVSTIVRDEDGDPSDYLALPINFNLISAIPDTACQVAEVDRATGRLGDPAELIDFEDIEDEARSLGVAKCPVTHSNVDYRNDGSLDIKIETKEIPGYEGSRYGIESLGSYGFPENSDDKSTALIYEMAFKLSNATNDHYMLYTFYYEMFIWRLAEPEDLGAYEYVGTFTPQDGEPREYYIYKEATPYNKVKTVAQNLRTALGAQLVYALDINSAQEASFLQGRINTSSLYWLGYDDISSESTWVPHSGSAPFVSRHGSNPSGRFTNWHPGPPDRSRRPAPHNGRKCSWHSFISGCKERNWDAAVLNYHGAMKWGDFDHNQSLPIIFEVHYSAGEGSDEYGVLE